MNSSDLKVSVILPTYQGARYISQTLQSISDQTRVPDEVIVSVDESTDGTREIVRDFSASTKFNLIAVDHRQSGISANYFNALEEVSGDVVIVSDHDDIWLPNKTAIISGVFKRDPTVSIVSSDSTIVDEFLNPTGSTLRGGETSSQNQTELINADDFRGFLMGGGRLDAHTLAFHSSVTSRLKLIEEAALPEFWFEEKIAIAAMSIGKLEMIPKALTLYRTHPNQHVGNVKFGLSDHLKPRKNKKFEQLKLLEKLILTNKEDRLIEGSLWQERLEMLGEYLKFMELRNMESGRMETVQKLLIALLQGKYARFTHHSVLSFAKDLTLLFKRR